MYCMVAHLYKYTYNNARVRMCVYLSTREPKLNLVIREGGAKVGLRMARLDCLRCWLQHVWIGLSPKKWRCSNNQK
jgi:hypothetical protein